MKNQSPSGADPEAACLPLVDANKFFSLVPEMACVLTGEGVFCFVNPASERLLGFLPEELLGTSLFSRLPASEIEKVKQALCPLTSACPQRQFETRFVCKNGTQAPIRWSGTYNPDDGLFYGLARDGAEKQQVEQHLLKTQQAARVGNYEFDIATGRYTYVSDSVFEIFGLDKSDCPEFTSELFWQLLHPDDAVRVRQEVVLAESLVSSVLAYRIIRPDGGVVLISRIREVVQNQAGQPVKIIGLLRDVTNQWQAEQVAAQSEARFRALVQNSHDTVGIVDATGVYCFVGESVGRQLGYEAADLVGQNAFGYIHPEDVPMARAVLQNLNPGAVQTTPPLRFRNRAGEWRWMETTVSNQLHNPAIGGIVVNSRDVTEQLEKEAERREYEECLALQNHMMVEVLEQMREGFVTVTLDGKVIYWNREAERISGRSRSEVLGKSVWEAYSVETTHLYRQLYQRLLTQTEPVSDTMYLPHRNRWIRFHAYRTQKGLSFFFRDVTKAIKTNGRLRRLSLLVRKTSNMVVVYNRHRQIQWVNKAFCERTGYALHECIGQRIDALCSGPAPDEETVRHVAEKIGRNEAYRMEVLNHTRNGEPFWTDVTCQPLLNKRGEAVQYFAIATDITGRKNLEAQLEAEQKARQMKIAAATLQAQERERTAVSQELHDNVNQVLTTVKLYVEMCRDGMTNSYEMLTKSIQLLQDSITEIRSLSKRLSAPSLGRIRLADSVRELMDAVAATKKLCIELDTTGIEQKEFDQELHLVIYRILQEHTTNVLKHAAATRLCVRLDCQKGRVLLAATDNGKGFDPAQKSNGIGVSNMLTRAESLKGSLRLQSAPGCGCTLTVCIPV